MKINKVPDEVFCGLGKNLHKITDQNGQDIAYVGVKDGVAAVAFQTAVPADQLPTINQLVMEVYKTPQQGRMLVKETLK
jgi:hypothetical protein